MEKKQNCPVCRLMVLYTENTKDPTRKLLELINELGKVVGYKINTLKSLSFLYINNKRFKREINETIYLPSYQKETSN